MSGFNDGFVPGGGASSSGPATQVDESGGATLDVGAIADGQYVRRSGTDLVGVVPPNSMVFTWGNYAVGLGADTRYLPYGGGHYEGAAPSTSDIHSVVVPVAGTFSKLYVRHNNVAGNGNSVVYQFEVNGSVPSNSPTVTLATNAAGTGSDLVNTMTVAAGARVSCKAVKALAIGDGSQWVMVSMLFTPS